MDIRDLLYEREERTLSRYATFSRNTRGREQKIEESPIRTEFMRDRDRIVHSASFRRLKDKTQVFIGAGDNFRTRLTHTMEVSQLARTIARLLSLNEDLTEAIALGHDLGHTPFGHAGERAIAKHIPFEHNRQSLRIVEKLENGKGLNLTYEVRNGILCHKSSFKPETLEGYAVNRADKIAYINHDIDDAVRAGVITIDDLPKDTIEVLGYTHGQRINTMISDIVENSMDRGELIMSKEVSEATAKLRKFMFENVYLDSAARTEEVRVNNVIDMLYEHYTKHPEQIPAQYAKNIEEDGLEVCVGDYIAGMTDRYAVEKFNELFIPRSWINI